MHDHPRPLTSTVSAPRTSASGRCPECGGGTLASYRVMSEGGWWSVIKCQECLASIAREAAPMFGAFTPFGAPE